MVTPIYYVFFTTFVILASSILYKEWSCLGASDVIGNVIGFLTTIIGIFQMQLFRDVDISLKRFRVMMHSQSVGHVELVNSSTNLVDAGGSNHRRPQNGYTSDGWQVGSESDNEHSSRNGSIVYA